MKWSSFHWKLFGKIISSFRFPILRFDLDRSDFGVTAIRLKLNPNVHVQLIISQLKNEENTFQQFHTGNVSICVRVPFAQWFIYFIYYYFEFTSKYPMRIIRARIKTVMSLCICKNVNWEQKQKSMFCCWLALLFTFTHFSWLALARASFNRTHMHVQYHCDCTVHTRRHTGKRARAKP